MEPLLAVAGFITVAAITPGPNNVIVMAAAAHGGIRAAVPAMAGVILGSLALLGLAWIGAAGVLAAGPRLQLPITLAGAFYLVWLGGTMIWRTRRSALESGERKPGALPDRALPVATFQFLNPKSWALVLTATAAVSGLGQSGLAALAAMFVVLPALCLSLWAYAGTAIAHHLRYAAARRRFDWIMGCLLIGSAALLLA